MPFGKETSYRECGCKLCQKILKVIKDRRSHLTEDELYARKLRSLNRAFSRR